jgi:hypothetical protein
MINESPEDRRRNSSRNVVYTKYAIGRLAYQPTAGTEYGKKQESDCLRICMSLDKKRYKIRILQPRGNYMYHKV